MKPFGDLSGRVAVVTGSSSGIGRAIALEFAAAGADVVVHCARSLERAESVAAAIRTAGRRSVVLAADFSDRTARERFVAEAWGAFGRVDVWVNNAGVDLLTGPARDLGDEEKLQRLCEVDVMATVLLSRRVGARMKQRGRGVILNIGWDQAETGMEGVSGELFAAAKAAVMGFSRSLAVSLAPEVRVNCLAPGWIRTAWGESASAVWQERVIRETPLRRWGTPEDVARYARFLASDDAAYVTGQVVNVNGGAER
ncbi:MAG: SDR family oxidoreductase [Planctomycetota bacterium]|nr:MAG: SDR family oxidoreductase [Planctomycetota bacterium]